jgi:hypothetical protein
MGPSSCDSSGLYPQGDVQPADRPGTAHAVIWWETREARESVSADQVPAVDERMGNWLHNHRPWGP